MSRHQEICLLRARTLGARKSLNPFLPCIPTALLAPTPNAIANEVGLPPRDIMITRPDVRTLRIPEPFLREEYNRIILSNHGSRLDSFPGHRCSYRGRNIASRTKCQMPNLSRSRINFDEVGVISPGLK